MGQAGSNAVRHLREPLAAEAKANSVVGHGCAGAAMWPEHRPGSAFCMLRLHLKPQQSGQLVLRLHLKPQPSGQLVRTVT